MNTLCNKAILLPCCLLTCTSCHSVLKQCNILLYLNVHINFYYIYECWIIYVFCLVISGVFVLYEFSPMMVQYTEKRRSSYNCRCKLYSCGQHLWQLLAQLCTNDNTINQSCVMQRATEKVVAFGCILLSFFPNFVWVIANC